MRAVKAAWGLVAAAALGCGSSGTPPDGEVGIDAGPTDPCAPDDRDGDGHAAFECGGDDCDDADSGVWRIAPPPTGSGIWTVEPFGFSLDATRQSAPIAVDDSGVWHVLFDVRDGDGPLHLSGGPGAWEEEFVGLPTGEIASLDVAPDGSLHAAAESGHLTNASGRWTLKPYPADAGSAKLAVDRQGVVHVVYQTGPPRTIWHGSTVGDGWTTEVITEVAFDSFALAIDPEGRLHVVFGGDRLHHALQADGSWNVEDVADADQSGTPTVAIDAGGALHVAFKDGRSLEYATNRTGSWVREYLTVAHGWDGMGMPFLALDPRGRPRIALTGTTGPGREVGVAVRLASGWAPQNISRAADGESQLAVAASGAALLSFGAPDDEDGGLRLASTPGLDWVCED